MQNSVRKARGAMTPWGRVRQCRAEACGRNSAPLPHMTQSPRTLALSSSWPLAGIIRVLGLEAIHTVGQMSHAAGLHSIVILIDIFQTCVLLFEVVIYWLIRRSTKSFLNRSRNSVPKLQRSDTLLNFVSKLQILSSVLRVFLERLPQKRRIN